MLLPAALYSSIVSNVAETNTCIISGGTGGKRAQLFQVGTYRLFKEISQNAAAF